MNTNQKGGRVVALPLPPRNVPLPDDEDGRIELEQYTWRDRRRRMNDEQAWEDMTRGTSSDVPRGMHQPPPAMGVGILLGLGTVVLALAVYFATVAYLDHP